MDAPRAASLIAIYTRDIPTEFPEAALAQARGARPAPMGEREDLRSLPLVTIDGEDAKDFDDAVYVEIPKSGPAFILYPNFKAVMNWNRSTLYALSVAVLAQQIAGGPTIVQSAPTDDEPLSRDTVVDLQTRLARLGFYTDEADGLLGPKTRSAVRMFQKQAGLPADGHPTPEVVARLQRAVR